MAVNPLTQIQLLFRVRWLVFRNGLRSKMKKRGLVWDVVMYCVLALALMGTSTIFALTGYYSGTQHQTGPLLGVLWFIFVFWLVVPAAIEGASPGLNFTEVARYPLSFRLFFLLASSYGFLDLAAIAAMVWLTVCWVALLIARASMAIALLPTLALFVLLSLYMNRWTFAWLERVLSTRKGRERMLMALFAFSFLMQIFGNLMQKIGPWLQQNAKSLLWLMPYLKQAMPVLSWVLPPNLVLHGMTGGLEERLAAMAILAGMTLFCMWRYARKLALTFAGEIYSESNRSVKIVGRKLGWKLPGASIKVSAVVQKEITYILGQPQMLYNLSVPLLFTILTVFKTNFGK